MGLESSVSADIQPGNQYFKGGNPGLNTTGRMQQARRSAEKRQGSAGLNDDYYSSNLSNSYKRATSRNPNYTYPLGTVWKDAAGKEVGLFRLNFPAMLMGDGYSDVMLTPAEGS